MSSQRASFQVRPLRPSTSTVMNQRAGASGASQYRASCSAAPRDPEARLRSAPTTATVYWAQLNQIQE